MTPIQQFGAALLAFCIAALLYFVADLHDRLLLVEGRKAPKTTSKVRPGSTIPPGDK